jgi:hypothetical protein
MGRRDPQSTIESIVTRPTICSKSAAKFRLTVAPPSLSDTHHLDDRAAARLVAGFDELEYA